MCGRFTVLTFEEVVAVVEAVEGRRAPQVLEPLDGGRACAFPGNEIPLIAPDERGELQIAQATWGFEAPWNGKLVFNTRIESALDGVALWRDAIQRGRCIIPVAAFFEPHATETVPSPRTGKPMKRPYVFADPSGAPLLLAGVRSDDRCSIVTCAPNRWVAPIHDRMPLVMRFQEATTWLASDWQVLADRCDLQLHVLPERLQQPQPPEQSDQLSLF